MQGEHGEEATRELLGDLTWARELAVSLVGEAFADDVLQETRLAVLRSGGAVAVAEQIPPRAWLRVVLQRFALQVLRSEGARKRREESVSREEALPSPLELSARLEQQQLLGREVSALGEPYRSTLLLRYSEGLQPKEIARRLGIPAGTVRWRLKNALDQLRLCLDEDNDGDRGSWMAALAPLLRTPSSSPPISSPPSTPSGNIGMAVGSLLLKNKIVAAVAAVLVGFGLYQWSESEAIEPAVTLALEAEPSPAGSDSREMTETLEPAKGPDLAGERLSAGGTPVEGVDEPSTGWWLVGFVSGIPEGEHASTSLRITGSRGSGWAKHAISAGVQPDGSVRVDLQEIFRSERVLPSELIARVSHPGLRPAEQKWLLGRQERQAGFLPGELVLFELDRELSPAPGGVRGVVTLPVGYEPEDVLISLIPVLEDGPDTCASVSQERCDAAGEFRLGFDQPGRYHLLATHKKRMLRPRFIDLELTEGQVELDQPLELDEGAVLEGAVTLNSAVPNFDLDLGVSEKVFVSRPYCPTLPHTFWIDGSYQYNSVSCRTADAGRIRITGMVPGVYKLRVNSVLIDGEWVRLGSLGRGVRAIREVEFPNSIAVIDFGFQIQLFRTVTGGEPLPYVRVQARTRNASSTTNTGAKGQFAQAYVVDSSSEPTLRLDFSEEGYEKRSVPIVGGAQTLDWQEVEMSPTVTGEATLVLSLFGDPDRSMERFSLFLLREGERYGSSNLLPWQKTQWKRGDGPVRIDGIEAGAYRLTFKADSPSNPSQMYWPDTASAILNEEFEIEFSPGERRELSLRLRDGGRLFLPAICPGGDCGDRTGSLHFRIKAGGGESIKASWVTAADSGKRHRTIGTLNLRLDSFLEPPLEPGDYELEVWCLEGEVDLVAHPFRILAGEITRMDLDDPR